MNRSGSNIRYRILLMALILIMVPVLCGCRTRITNNNEVTSVLTDEDGTLSEEYQMRRDELSIPTAEPPIIKGGGDDDDYYDYDEYYDDDADMLSEFDYEEEEEKPKEQKEEKKNNPTGPGGTTRPGGTTPSRPTPQPSTQKIKVTLDPNGGTCSVAFVEIEKGKTYGNLPAAEREGYEFQGWYTDKSKGTKITSDKKVSDKAHTLYAHWKEKAAEPEPQPEPEPEKKIYKIKYDLNGEGAEFTSGEIAVEIEEGGIYGTMPTATREGYTFAGWFTAVDGGNKVDKDTIVGGDELEQTLYAHWDKEPAQDTWNKKFDKTVNDIDPKDSVVCIIDDGDDVDEDLLKSCRGKLPDDEEEPQYIVKFVKNSWFKDNPEKLEETATGIYDSYLADHPDANVTVILMSDKASKGSNTDQKLWYKLVLLDALHGRIGEDELNRAAEELGVSADVSYPYYYPPIPELGD